MKIDLNKETEVERFYNIAVEIRKDFQLSFPFYSDNKNVNQISIDTKGNAAFFICEFNEMKARAGAYFYPNSKVGYIGWFESHNDNEVSKQVLNECVNYLKENGIEVIYGPINGSTFYNYRFNLNYEMPSFPSEPFQPLYYIQQWENYGFEISESYITTYSEFPNIPMPKEEEVKKMFASMGLSFEKLTVDLLKEIWKDFYEFLLVAFQSNQHYSPISFEVFNDLMKGFPKAHDGEHSFIVFDANRKVIGFVTCLSDLFYEHYQKNNVSDDLFSEKKLIIKTMATHPDWQNKKIATLIASAIFTNGIKEGFKKVINALMWQENITAIGSVAKFQAIPRIKYALYKLK